MKVVGVYRILHTESGRSYVGHSIDVLNRFAAHRSRLRSGTHHCVHLQRAWRTYGDDAFQFALVQECPDQASAATLEQRLIDDEMPSGRLYNTLAVNAPLAVMREIRARAHTPEAIRRRVQATLANGTWCAGQRMAVRTAPVNGGPIVHHRSLSEAARALGISKGNLSSVCNGERKSAGGHFAWFHCPEAERAAA